MTNLRNISYYLGMQVDHIVGKKIILYQSIYFLKILNHFKMTGYKPAFILMNSRVVNSLLPYDGNADKAIIKGTSQLLDPLYGWLYILAQILPIQ